LRGSLKHGNCFSILCISIYRYIGKNGNRERHIKVDTSLSSRSKAKEIPILINQSMK
jgi:hypothetical protein